MYYHKENFMWISNDVGWQYWGEYWSNKHWDSTIGSETLEDEDDNHRFEFFSSSNSWWMTFIWFTYFYMAISKQWYFYDKLQCHNVRKIVNCEGIMLIAGSVIYHAFWLGQLTVCFLNYLQNKEADYLKALRFLSC